jgi:hypothetical protein
MSRLNCSKEYKSGKTKPVKEEVEIITLDDTNIDSEDIVCVRGEKNTEGIERKKEWLKKRFKEGLKFKVLKVNGRSWGFIEYMPAEYCWRPIIAPGYIIINCMWVIGRYKGKGFGLQLLNECIKDAGKTNGIAIVCSDKSWMPKKDFFLNNGFEVCDTAFSDEKKPVFELLVKKFKKSDLPGFNENARKGIMKKDGMVRYFYSDQCPYIAQFLNKGVECAEIYDLPNKTIKFENREQAQKSFSPYESYCVFYDGKYISHDLNPRELAKKLSEISKGNKKA